MSKAIPGNLLGLYLPHIACAHAGYMPRDYRNADTTISATMPIIRLYFSA